MASIYKILGQTVPSNGNFSTVCIPSGAETGMIISSITICNTSTSNTYRIAIVPYGETLSSNHYIVYDTLINANDTCVLTLGITLGYGDSLQVRGPATGIPSALAFTAFGAALT